MIFLASNSLHNLGGKKRSCPCYHARHLKQIHWNQIFSRMDHLSMIASVTIVKLIIRCKTNINNNANIPTNHILFTIVRPDHDSHWFGIESYTFLKQTPFLLQSLSFKVWDVIAKIALVPSYCNDDPSGSFCLIMTLFLYFSFSSSTHCTAARPYLKVA